MQSLAYASWLKNWMLWSGVCIYTYPGGTPSISVLWFHSLLPGGVAGISVQGGAGRGCGAPVLLHLQRDCEFFAVRFWQGRQLSVWFWRIIAGCHSIAAFTLLCSGNSPPCFFTSRTAAQGFLMGWFDSWIAECENPPLTILTTFKAGRMSDCSSFTRPPCLAIVADMLNTYKTLVAPS